MMTVEIITIGTEYLLGRKVNENAPFMASHCASIGIPCTSWSVISDRKDQIEDSLKTALNRSQVVITCGGMGAGSDDHTREAAANVLGLELVEDTGLLEKVTAFCKSQKIQMTDQLKNIAMVPKGSLILENPSGIAAGLILEQKGKTLIMLPGRNAEMSVMFLEAVQPYLKEKAGEVIETRIVKLCGMEEGEVASQVSDLLVLDNPKVAVNGMQGEVHIRVTGRGSDDKEVKKLIKPVIRRLKEAYAQAIYTSEEEVSLEKAVVDLLIANDLSLATIESCTGGLLAGRITSVPGASGCFKSGYIAYSNKSKKKLAGVKERILEKYGAVSAETAKAMAKGIAQFTKADVTLAATGIAGPDGGTKEKPVGMVYISCNVCGTQLTREYHFQGNRERIRRSTTTAALILLRQCILTYYSEKTFG